MGNKPVPKIPFNSDAIRNMIQSAGYSIRSFAKAIGASDRSLRTWLEKGEMPERYWDEADPILRKAFKEPKRMKKGAPAMPKYIYLITDEAVSDDAHHSCFSKMAVESSKEAFDMLRRITSENDGSDNNVEWGFNFDRTVYARRVEVIGTGLFPFDVNNKMKELHGTRTISIEEIWLKERVRNECPLD